MHPVHVVRRRSASVLAASLAVLLLPAAAGAATQRPSAAIGPIKVKGGYQLYVSVYGCGGAGAAASLNFTKSGRGTYVSHSYGGASGKTRCSISKSLSSGTLSASWPGLLKLKLNLGHAGNASKLRPPAGCTGGVGIDRRGTARGTLQISIHTPVFGKINLRGAGVMLSRSAAVRCPPSRSTGTVLVGFFGTSTLSAGQPAHGARGVTFIDSTHDRPGAGINGTTIISVSGPSVFSAASDLSTANINLNSQWLTGSMRFTSHSGCTAADSSHGGTLSGTVTAHDPIIGTLTLSGPQATFATLSRGTGGGAC